MQVVMFVLLICYKPPNYEYNASKVEYLNVLSDCSNKSVMSLMMVL